MSVYFFISTFFFALFMLSNPSFALPPAFPLSCSNTRSILTQRRLKQHLEDKLGETWIKYAPLLGNVAPDLSVYADNEFTKRHNAEQRVRYTINLIKYLFQNLVEDVCSVGL